MNRRLDWQSSLIGVNIHYPYAPWCYKTVWFLGQMLVNILYMEHMVDPNCEELVCLWMWRTTCCQEGLYWAMLIPFSGPSGKFPPWLRWFASPNPCGPSFASWTAQGIPWDCDRPLGWEGQGTHVPRVPRVPRVPMDPLWKRYVKRS